MLLPDDIEAAGEARLLRDAPDDVCADVLVTSHHGSRTSSCSAVIDAVQPALTIHSAG